MNLDLLIERYWSAEITDDEQAELLRRLASSEADDKRYDDIKAVMGYMSIGKAKMQKASDIKPAESRSRKPWRAYVSAAAAVIIVLGIGLSVMWHEQNQCYAYVGNNKITDKEYVLADMRLTMTEMLSDENEIDVEKELTDIFNQ